MLQLVKENAVRITMMAGTAAILTLIGVYFTFQMSAVAAEKVGEYAETITPILKDHGGRIGDLEKSMVKVVTIQQEQSKTFTNQLDRFDRVLIRFEDRLNNR